MTPDVKASTIKLFPGLLTVLDGDMGDTDGWRGWREELSAIIVQHEQLADALEAYHRANRVHNDAEADLYDLSLPALRAAGRLR